MSRIKSDKVNFAESIVVDFFSSENEEEKDMNEDSQIVQDELLRLNLLQKEAQDKAIRIIDDAKNKAKEIIDGANAEAGEILRRAHEESALIAKEASEVLEKSKIESENLISNAQNESVQIREKASQEGAKDGYDSGYKDGLEKIKQEFLQKINDMEEITQSTFDIKNKILISSKREIVDLVLMIARKISVNSIDCDCIASVVNKAISLLTDKENIELILSERYAKLLNQVLNDDLLGQKPDLEIDIDKLRSIKLVYNSKIPDDTLIVQTPKERLDLSFNSQLDNISKEFLKELNTSFDKKDEGDFGQV